MQLKLNGEHIEAEPGTTVEALLGDLAIGTLRVAVAVNGEVSPRAEHARRILDDGDEVEVIQAVAGG